MNSTSTPRVAGRVETIIVRGYARDEFEPLIEVFARMVGAQGLGGAALAIYRDGRQVVDLTGGDYRLHGLQLLFSITKSVTAIAAAIAHAEGLLDLDAPLADCWPAFARRTTAAITTRDVLNHRSGLAAFDRVLTFDELVAGDDEAAIEVQDPYWKPGTAHGYHAFTFGTLLNGVFRRVLDKTVGEFAADRLAGPLHLDLWVGLPASELPRLQQIHYLPAVSTPGQRAHAATSSIPISVTTALEQVMDLWNHPSVATACWPATSGVASARDLARLFAATVGPVDGLQLLDAPGLAELTASQSHGPDRTLGFVTHFGSGVQRPFPVFPMLTAQSFGHEGAGGSAAIGDPELGLSVGFTTSSFPTSRGASPGILALQAAIRHCAMNHDPVS